MAELDEKFVKPKHDESDVGKECCCPYCGKGLGEITEPITDVTTISPWVSKEGKLCPTLLYKVREVHDQD